MTLIRKTRAYFFIPTSVTRADGTVGGTRLLQTDKPSEETMRRLADSAAFPEESADRAKLSTGGDLGDEQGLAVLATDVQAKANTAQLADRSIVAQPHQLPTVSEGTDDGITNTVTPFAGIAMDIAPDATATRNHFIVKLSTTFRTWLGGVIDSLATSIASVSSTVTALAATLAGGTNGQVLTKGASTYDWADPHYVPAGGSTGQALIKTSGTDYDATWQSLPSAVGMTPVGGIIMYDGPDSFDINGIGTGALLGWALCTGYGGLTPNLSGKFVIAGNTFGITTIGSVYSDASGVYPYALGDTGGIAKHKLTSGESGLRIHEHRTTNGMSVLDAGQGLITGTKADQEDPDISFYINNQDTEGPIDADGDLAKDGAQDANDYHENRPPYYALAYIKRLS